MKPARELDAGGVVVAVALILISVGVLWQAQAFTAFASIFPRAVGIALLLSSLLVLWKLLRKPSARPERVGGEGLVRSGLLVLVLLAWVQMLERAGFALSSCVGFFLLALLANRDPLRPTRLLLFAACAIVGVLLLQGLFRYGLDVRLPVGSWWGGVVP